MGNKFEVDWRGQKYLMEWFDNIDFESLDNAKNVFGFIFNDEGSVCVVKSPLKGRWTLPGGGVEEYDKTFEDTLIRELDEEADLDLKDIRRMGYFKVIPKSDNCENGTHYLLRFAARIKRIGEQTIDPCDNVLYERKFIPIEEFSDYIKWGHEGEFQLRKALEALKHS